MSITSVVNVPASQVRLYIPCETFHSGAAGIVNVLLLLMLSGGRHGGCSCLLFDNEEWRVCIVEIDEVLCVTCSIPNAVSNQDNLDGFDNTLQPIQKGFDYSMEVKVNLVNNQEVRSKIDGSKLTSLALRCRDRLLSIARVDDTL